MQKMIEGLGSAGGSSPAATQVDAVQVDDYAHVASISACSAIGRRRFLGLGAAAIAASMAGAPVHAALPTRGPMRATWVASVLNLDWPSAASSRMTDPVARVMVQQQELLTILDQAEALHLNTLVFQVKPCADALYRSAILPWSPVLTGVLGKDPGFDPLAFLLHHAHARGIQVHAWLNPYRVSTDISQATLEMLTTPSGDSPPSVYAHRPEWVGVAANRLVLDPGIPAVRRWICAVVAELIVRYDVDGVQFDDYFYSETAQSPLDDAQTYARHGAGFADKGDWRRNNTYRLMRDVGRTIRAIRPRVAFGVSPAGVWRNRQDDPLGSDTQAGAPSFDVAYADTRRWVREELVDYIVPQIYWPFARQIVRYDTIARWWADTVGNGRVQLYIGMALYKVGLANALEPDWAVAGGVPEIARQLDLNAALPQIRGCMLFRHGFLAMPQTAQVVDYLKLRWQGG
ncbi:MULTISPECIES: glycoside hydrolase family 10 protein [Xanthomonas]|uniref:Family 10 glycosylhydrolase n=1 Tax=Xanthomonas dyei TaxID=743699 RepID=A0ABZ0D9D4_9XANT|nr:glycoside hydrolase family 10 protein [Xanthomonas dyei]MCC4632113.1 family 10 glycosylhydrolase [Xanthomonas dyei pv. eucalypti]WOB26888.1 family 10 glycosylhydrolase [Xanthomonas dyei]WOB54508.1 family 10 glycosylhydrolase [Xanthomonas dyei]